MAVAVLSIYSRVTPKGANAGAGEVQILSDGTLGTDYYGSLNIDGITGDVIRLFAWGNFNNTSSSAGTGRIRLYLNPMGGPVIADTGSFTVPANTSHSGHREWTMLIQITIKEEGEEGVGICEGYLMSHTDPTNWTRMFAATTFAINTMDTNSLDLTFLVTTQGAITLTQCTIEEVSRP